MIIFSLYVFQNTIILYINLCIINILIIRINKLLKLFNNFNYFFQIIQYRRRINITMFGFEIDIITNIIADDDKELDNNFNALQDLKVFNFENYSGNYDNEFSLNALTINNINMVSLCKDYKSYQCLVCEKLFNQRSTYQNHIQLHEKYVDDSCRCNICGKTFAVPARLTRHYRTHTGEKPYQCEYCNKSFSVKENLSVHRRIHTKERPYKCDICKSAFEHSGKLHRHMRIHTGERPHKCTLCSKTFIQSGQLVIHMRTHTGEKPYICKSCGKGFTCSKQLKVHTRTHTGEKPYKCDICGKSFGYNHVLKLHQVGHYGEKFYKCTLCHETFSSKKLMELHIKSHSETVSDLSNTESDINKNTEVTSTMLIEYKNNHETDQILITQNKKGRKNATLIENRIFEIKDKTTPSHCNTHTQNSYRDNTKSSKAVINQSYVSTNTHSCASSQLRTIPTESINCQDTSTTKQALTRHILTNFHLSEFPICDITKTNSYLTSNEFEYDIKHKLDQFNEHQQINEEIQARMNSTSISDNLLSTSSSSKPMNFLISNTRNCVNLPLRKRYRMVLEFMDRSKSDLIPMKKCNSVIQFAKADKNNLIEN